jgi:hypothetical protein
MIAMGPTELGNLSKGPLPLQFPLSLRLPQFLVRLSHQWMVEAEVEFLRLFQSLQLLTDCQL